MRSASLMRLTKKLRVFRSETRASIMPLFAVLILLMIVIGGAGVDYGRAVMARSTIANALDSAVLTIARELSVKLMTDAEISTAINKTFEANLASAGLTGISMSPITYSINPEQGLVSATATANVPTSFIFMGGIGPKDIPVSVDAQSTYSLFDVELAMIVDVTGSMGSYMGSLRTAAQAIVDILIPIGTDPDESKVRISLTPYSQGVNMGEYAGKITNNNNGSRNCVTERDGPKKYSDEKYDYAGSSSEYFGGGTNSCASRPTIEPLTNKRDTLKSAISKLVASGMTAGQTGISIGWYTLSPNWNNLWKSDNKAAAYGKEKLQKIALIMTDGDFNAYYYKERLNKNQCNSIKNGRNGYKYINESCRNGTNDYWIEHIDYSGYNGQPSVIARKYCDAMKTKDIRLYTVYFGTSPNSAGAKVMQYCASDPGTYFIATNSQALIGAFQKIANQIQSIYLSK